MSEQSPSLDVRRYDSTAGIGLAQRIWPCYDEVFGDFDDYETWKDDLFARHANRSGYGLVVATEGTMVAGFSWGYIGERGQSLSTTDDLADPAVQLYLGSGWRKLGTLRPGTQVMGRAAGK